MKLIKLTAFIMCFSSVIVSAKTIKEWTFKNDFSGKRNGAFLTDSGLLLPENFTIFIWSLKPSYKPRETALFSQKAGKSKTFEIRNAYEAVRLLIYPKAFDKRIGRQILPRNKWTAIACTRKGDAIKIYVNGKLQFEGKCNYRAEFDSKGQVITRIGGSCINSKSSFTGKIAYVCIIDEALDKDKIIKLISETKHYIKENKKITE